MNTRYGFLIFRSKFTENSNFIGPTALNFFFLHILLFVAQHISI